MTDIRYRVVPSFGGWSISCNSVVGRPYLTRLAAIRDMRWAAHLLEAAGEDVAVDIDDAESGRALRPGG